MSSLYGLYDMQDSEQCVYIGNMKQMCKNLGKKPHSLYSYLNKKKTGKWKLIAQRYELVKIDEDKKEDENKNKYKVFLKIVEAFQPQQIKFPIWDEREQELKRVIK